MHAPRTWPAVSLRYPAVSVDTLALLFDDLQPVAIEDQIDGPSVVARVFFASPAARDEALVRLRDRAEALSLSGLESADVEDEGWAERNQADLRAVRVGRVIVAPPWDAPGARADSPVVGANDIVVIVQPSMGFGTGHHQSTRLCIGALQHLELCGASVIDVGTGSGVLAILARKLGALTAIGIDNDPDAIASARENVALNHLEGQVDIRCADLGDMPNSNADVVIANLTAGLLDRESGRLIALGRPGGYLVISGFTTYDEPRMRIVFDPTATLIRRDEEDDWVALTVRIT